MKDLNDEADGGLAGEGQRDGTMRKKVHMAGAAAGGGFAARGMQRRWGERARYAGASGGEYIRIPGGNRRRNGRIAHGNARSCAVFSHAG